NRGPRVPAALAWGTATGLRRVGQTPAVSSVVDPYERAAVAGGHLRSALGRHDAAVVLGSGWAGVGERLGSVVAALPSSELPGAPAPPVPGREGSVLSVRVPHDGGELAVLVVAGRSHLYEGHDAAAVVHTVRAAVQSGCSTVVLTN